MSRFSGADAGSGPRRRTVAKGLLAAAALTLGAGGTTVALTRSGPRSGDPDGVGP